MRSIVLVGIVVFSASTCLAQTTEPPQPDQAAAPQQGGPANLCQEILAFMKTPPPETAAPAAAKPASEPAPKAETGTSSAMDGTSDSDEAVSAEADAGTNSAQDVTGQDGVATDAPEPDNGQAADSGSVEDAPQKDSRAAPTPPADVTSTPRESVLTVEAAEQLAAANDIGQCQKTAREMRVAGVEMPSPLIALAALDLKYQQASGAANAPAGNDVPAEDE